MTDTTRTLPRPVGEAVPPLTDEQMCAALQEGQALSKRMADCFRKTVTITDKELSFRFVNHPVPGA
ncbi:MAG: hypothetical protein HQL96_02320 [Magnetococcales bacterium]|nr:hypothetical protein [Magnetococcales bacterium]